MDLRKIGYTYNNSLFTWFHYSNNGHYSYQIGYNRKLPDGKLQEFKIPSRLLSDLLIAENECRTFAQSLESESKLPSLKPQKTDLEEIYCETEEESDSESTINDTSTSTQKWSVLSDARTSPIDPLVLSAKYAKSERKFYHKLSDLPDNPFRNLIFDFNFKDRKWYLRFELSEDCYLRGGCCGQGCGCCKSRGKSLHPGLSGHCTPACACCQKRKNTSPTLEELEEYFEEEKKALESDNPFYLLRMADSYFRDPKAKEKEALDSSKDSSDTTPVVETAKAKEKEPLESPKGSSEPPRYEEKSASSTTSSRSRWFDLSPFKT